MDMSNASDEVWPQDAAPEHWVMELFKRMGRMWGNAFLEKWPQDDLYGVKIEWARGLRKLSSKELKAGVDALITLKFAPSLSEFYALCKHSRAVEFTPHAALTDQSRARPEVVAANLSLEREIVAPLAVPRMVTAEWAYKLLMRGSSASGKPLTSGVLRCATDAISSAAGRRVIDECPNPTLADDYRKIRDTIIENYRTQGLRLWSVQ